MNYDIWKLSAPDEPDTGHCELCDCENSVEAFREYRIGKQLLMICDICFDNETESNDEKE